MTSSDRVILVIDDQPERANQLRDMIEFMDAPSVRVLHPNRWRENVEDLRIAAVFLSDSVSEAASDRVVRDIGRIDPNIPIVMLSGENVEESR